MFFVLFWFGLGLSFSCCWSRIPRGFIKVNIVECTSTVSSMFFMGSGHTFKSLGLSKLFVCELCDILAQFHSFACGYQLSQHHLLKILSLLHSMFWLHYYQFTGHGVVLFLGTHFFLFCGYRHIGIIYILF